MPPTLKLNPVMIFAPFFRSIKIGKMSQTPSHILENLQTALPAVAKVIKGGWDNIQNFAIKTNSSVSLPIWSCTLNNTEGRRLDSLQTVDAEVEDEDIEKEEEKVAKEQASVKGRKRVTNADEEIEGVEEPRKRSKAADGTKVVFPSPKSRSKAPAVPDPTQSSLASSSSAAPDAPLKRTKSIKRAQDVVKDKKVNGSDILSSRFGSSTKVSISKEEMRQKRSANTGQKKKRIVIMSKRSRSVKNAVLGKKVGQE